MNPEKNNASNNNADREIVISRVFDAPRELVWEAWTNPRHVAQWWGPVGFTTTIEEMDVRPGGVWKQVMHGPDGTNFPNRSIFSEVLKPERIVFSNAGGKAGEPGVHFVSTWTFEKLGEQTRVTIRMVFSTVADREKVVQKYGAIEGGKQTLARLAEHLPTMAPADAREFVITREFDAPRERVWKAWTDSKHMAQWWGPHHFTNPVCELDVRPGGAWRIVMRGPDGADHPAKGVYREVVPPARLAFTINHSELSDEWHDMVNPHRDQAAGKPGIEVLTTVTLEELGGKTKLIIRLEFASAAVRDSLLNIGMSEGWGQSLERLGALVGKAGLV